MRRRGTLGALIRIGGDTHRALVLIAGGIWRRLMSRTTFIAITGSVGKTTCSEAIAAVLSSRFPTISTAGGGNSHKGIARTIARVRPWHRYAVIEIGIDGPGQMKRLARSVKPDIVVWVSVARTHTMNFRTLDAIALEKSLLVSHLRPGGIAVLNDDYPHIEAYRPPPGVKAIYYGRTTRSEYSASDATSRWPRRLSFTTRAGSESVEVNTRFLGEHWVSSLVPALAIGRTAGISLGEAAEALSKLEPQPQRLSVVEIPNGPTFIRDKNASIDTTGPAFRILEHATAKRKILVVTDVTDSTRKARRRLRWLGAEAARIADAVVFVGDRCERGVAGAVDAGMPAHCAWYFYDIRAAADHLRTELREGDLVLLRSRRLDHLDRLYLTLTTEVGCWKNRCPKHIDCDRCPELVTPRRKSRLAAITTFEEEPEEEAEPRPGMAS
jgi:UDP-N-acetylmuramoyl-tripeptide--D-alanyl-D-alanine ligase